VIGRLALAELRNRPGRALFLLGGYALGVAVMVVLLAVGEAMLEQARDRELVGGGDLVLVPAGIDPEMLKAGGVSSLFLGIDHARFLQRNLLESPRGREEYGIVAASPLLDGRPVELEARGRRVLGVATGEDPRLYLTLAVGGALATEAGWGGQLLLTVREPEGHRAVTRSWPAAEVAFDTASPDLRFGVDASVTVTDEGRYRVTAEAEGHRLDFELAPSPGRYLPPTDLGGEDLISGYVAPVLHGRVDGTLCLPACEGVTGATGYHDHNWGVWRDVSWEWGAASDETTSLLYGMVRPPEGGEESLFVYLVDERGPVGIYRPGEMRTLETERRTIDGITLEVPVRLGFEDPRRGLSVEIEVTAVNVTDMDRERRPYFLQMRGVATVRTPGRLDRLPGFFETYLERY
jgi:hypothetical protein